MVLLHFILVELVAPAVVVVETIQLVVVQELVQMVNLQAVLLQMLEMVVLEYK